MHEPPRDHTELLHAVWQQNDLLLHQQHFLINQQGNLMSTVQDVTNEMFATKTALGKINATLQGVMAAVGTLRKTINDLRAAGGISTADADLLLSQAKDLTATALQVDADTAGIDTNPDDDAP